MVRASVVVAHRHGSQSPLEAPAGSGSIASQAQAMITSLQRLGFDTIDNEEAPSDSGPTASVDVDVAVIEYDKAAPADQQWAAQVAGLQDAGVPLIVRHHDVASPNEIFTTVPSTMLVHAATSLRNRRELIAVGQSDVALLPYTFDVSVELAPSASRQVVRDDLGLDTDTILFLQPTRISERKNLAGSVRYLQQLARILPPSRLHFWATGPIDPAFQHVFDKLLPHMPVQTTIRRVADIASALTACDVVLYPTTAERFGPVIFESIQARRPCVVGSYPILGEIQAQGIQLFALDEPSELVRFLAKPNTRLHDVNQRRAMLAFGPDVFDAALYATIQRLGVRL